ncbi:DUF6881 domain-containing protein [[Actinomadura] parvosata]|uniref:DUF6881 domain-containing protein n=1 Tax=[Actinomadura] parvosata TaxID=1955412 RepID=UPI00406CEA49
MVWYLRVEWHHDFPEEPVALYSEIDDDGYETRKVQLFRDGRLEWADATTETAMTGLSEVPVDSVEEIATQDEFSVAIITKEEYERLWRQAGGPQEPQL